MTKLRIAIITNVIPSYRKDFYRRLIDDDALETEVFCQSKIPGMNLNLVHDELGDAVTVVPFWSTDRERLAWQRLPFGKILESDVIFIYGNPRVLSGLLYSFLLPILGKTVVIWGQAHTGGASGILERARLCWWKRFRNIFVYNDCEASYLRRRGFGSQNIVGMNNGLNQGAIESESGKWDSARLASWQAENGVANKTVILSIARLEAKNRFELFVDSMDAILESVPNLLWVVIGDGPEKEYLLRYAESRNLNGNVKWLGSIYEEREIAPWFRTALCLVHPGAIGLSLLHAFGYGLPVVTHNNEENHMPEFCALTNQVNGLLFTEGDPANCAAQVVKLARDDALRKRLSIGAIKAARYGFNTGVMAARFRQMATSASVRAHK